MVMIVVVSGLSPEPPSSEAESLRAVNRELRRVVESQAELLAASEALQAALEEALAAEQVLRERLETAPDRPNWVPLAIATVSSRSR
ncbi:hypothetical protein BCD48_32210 [Pseudofrankia sp. BMG5.36]|nr:hypothetical protein BCD48_32210 [Pseudofrankia sp. BMG5.36]